MLRLRVTELEAFRVWRKDEELDAGWLFTRLLGQEPPSDAMQAGTAFHSALECAGEGDLTTLAYGKYRFDFACDSIVPISTVKELEIEKQYGDLLVTGHVDGLIGKEVVDYKTTGQFDPDRYMNSYQWRYYLDILEADRFRWEIFVISEFGQPFCYSVRQHHTLIQARYPGLHEDCERLAREYVDFAAQHAVLRNRKG